MTMKNNIEILSNSLEKLQEKENVIYFLVYDTKGNQRASVKYISDMALVLKNNGYNVKLLAEDNTYEGESYWLGNRYDSLDILSIKDDKVLINVEDVIVIPEYYSNALEKLANIKAIKVILIQQMDYVFETLPIGSRWSDFGFDKCITTNKNTKEYLLNIFNESIIYINPPFIGDNFKASEKPKKPFIAICVRDRSLHRKIISEFYLKYPNLRWISFKDMINMTYEEFSDSLRECAVSLWVDNESTFGTFPLESIKSNVPVIGLLPDNKAEWIETNSCIWVDNKNNLSTILGNFMKQWVMGNDFDELITPITYSLYTEENFTNSTLSIFNSLYNIRIQSIKDIIEKTSKAE
jgi:hypothetical protein